MSKRRAVLLCLLPALLFSAAMLVLRAPWPARGAEEIPARRAAQEELLTGRDGKQTALELLPGETLDINTATAEELTKLPGIGEALSQAIVEYREKNGYFSCIEDIMKVNGIGEGRFAAIKEYICAER